MGHIFFTLPYAVYARAYWRTAGYAPDMIMVTEIIEIDTTKADTRILMMHGNIKYSNYVIINANNQNVQIL